MRRGAGLAVGLLAGTAFDAVVGDPRRAHPVAAFGQLAGALEARTWADSRARGSMYTASCVGAAVGLGLLLRRLPGYPVVVAVSTWSVLGGKTLRAESDAVREYLARDELAGARVRLTHLVGRDTSELDESDVCRAVIESVAENTSDAVVAPLFWGAVAGIPGLLGYRAINTLDAMVGYKSERYLRFGWASARLDDWANLIPARLTALLTILLGGRFSRTVRVTRRDAAAHPSPNAGWCEASFAGALDLRLGGTNSYGERVEHRAVMGDGRKPGVDDLARASALGARVGLAAAVAAALVAGRPR